MLATMHEYTVAKKEPVDAQMSLSGQIVLFEHQILICGV
jgi:hypothetical protein